MIALMFISVIIISGYLLGMSITIEQIKGVVPVGSAFLVFILGVLVLIKIGEDAFPLNVFRRDWNTTFDAVSDALWLLDKEFNIVRTNRAAQELLGLNNKDIIGKHCWEVVHHTKVPVGDCPVKAMKKTGKSASSEIKVGDKWFFIIVNPILGFKGELIGVVHTIRDITDKKNVELEIVEMHKQNTLLADLLHNSSQPFTIIDPQGKITMCNSAFRNMIGYTEEDFKKVTNINSLTPLEWTESESKFTSQLIKTGKPVRYEKEYIRKDGSRVPVEIFLHLVKDSTGEIQFFYSFSSEITDRKKAERTLIDSEERFRKVADSAYEWIWEIDKDGLYTFCSSTVEVILGYKPEELVGKLRYFDLFTPDVKEELTNAVIQIFRKKEAFHGLIHKIKHKNGSLVTIKISGTPVMDVNGKLNGYLGTISDITQQQKNEEDLRKLSDRLLLATKSAKIGIWEYDFATQEAIWDETVYQLFDIVPGQNVDYNEIWKQRVHPKDLEEQERIQQKAINGNGKIDSMYRLMLKNGETRFIKVDAIVQRDASGTAIGFVGTNYDVTTIKLAEEAIRGLNEKLEQKVKERTERLEKTNKELEAFSHSISHDLRGPLRTIDGWSQILMEDYHHLLDDKGKLYLQRVRNGAQQMGLLMDAILKLFRIIRAELLISKVNLSDLAKKITKDLRVQFPERNVKVKIAEDMIVQGDVILLNVALANLLNNAWKFSSKKTEAIIEFGKKEIDNETVFFVKDNGAGYDMNYATKLFGAFQRMHTDKEFTGTGIGLATVQRIINRHGGRIWAEAEVDNGATFYFTIKEI
jgi:PAS domain S-box-containing protein